MTLSRRGKVRQKEHCLTVYTTHLSPYNFGIESRAVEREREAALEIGMRLHQPLSRSTSSDICPLNSISSTEQSNKQWESQRERGRERNVGEKKREKKGINDSKEEKSDRTGPAVPARHCFTSHCTEEENLSYAAAFHIAFTIYVPARIMQLDGSVERHP